MRHYHRVAIGLLGIIIATGCAGKGERIDLKVPIAKGTDEKVVAMSSATVAILPFEDHRTDRLHLGTRHHLWGGESRFSLSSGSLGETTAQAFADYLKSRGWNATLVKGNGAPEADVTMTGQLIDVVVDAQSGIGQTTLNAKSRLAVQVKNHADGSQVRETLTSTGVNQVFWFDPEDAQELLNELYNKNFEKFMLDTTLDGKFLKLR
ncbi:MAG TPA: YajG family lipoprotein [Nitrospiraceae bacterium]|nr:YajG family lipoprotein [Nitrospiraceae bacterium]